MKFRFSGDIKKVILSLAVIFFIFLLIWLGRAWWRPSPTAVNSPLPIEENVAGTVKTSAQIAAEYYRGRQDIMSQLLPYLSRQLNQDDIEPLTKLSDELIALAVPREQQPAHLRLVLKLSLLIDLLSPQKVRIATTGLPSVNQVQNQLKDLISEQSINLVN